MGNGDNRAVDAVKQAIDSPLLEVSIQGAKGVLINFTGGRDMGMHEIEEAAKLVHDSVDPEANIIWGMVMDENSNNEIKVRLVATGFDADRPTHSPMHFSGTSQLFQKSVGELDNEPQTPVAPEMPRQQSNVGEPQPIYGIRERDIEPVEPIEENPFVVSDVPRVREDVLSHVEPMVKAEPESRSNLKPLDEAEIQAALASDSPLDDVGLHELPFDDSMDSMSSPVRVQEKPIVQTLSTQYDAQDEDDYEQPAFLRRGQSIERSKIDEETPKLGHHSDRS